ncbi:PREDICTED: inorganic pyrophosphatase 3-like isoform X1 [Nicotiana attenuata]|nr:PREDICTED: inorganic pyrophosphatase 3-like isoform X1 [Nicotiana attenuata]
MNFVLRTSGLARNLIARSGLTTNFMGHPIGPKYKVRVAAASEQLSGSRQLTTACLIAGKSLNMAGAKTVIIFDFDRTVIDDDSDRWVVENMGLTHLFNQLRPTLPWNALMDRMMEELHSQGKTVEQIAECLKHVPLHPQTVSAIESAHALGCDLKVLSDANLFYIDTILKHHGLYRCFSEIITNPTMVDGEGRLRIFPYHDLASFHGCNLCPPNLCKGLVIEQIQASMSEKGKSRVIYLGDGRGDYCPTLKLDRGDHVMPRKGFPLWDRLLSNPSLLKADCHEWSNGEELASILLQLVEKVREE